MSSQKKKICSSNQPPNVNYRQYPNLLPIIYIFVGGGDYEIIFLSDYWAISEGVGAGEAGLTAKM